MNKKINKKLNKRKKKIDQRVKKRNWDAQPFPMFSGSDIHYDIDERNIGIASGGIGCIQLLAEKTGLIKLINKNIKLLKRHLPYHESDHILNIAYNVFAGGTRPDDIDLQRNDDAFLNAAGAEIIPDPTTAGDFLRRFEEKDVTKSMDIKNIIRQKVWNRQPEKFKKEGIADADGSISETTGECEERMDIAYNGQWGFHPLIISLANTGEPIYIINRPGNVPSHTDSAKRTGRSLDLVSDTFDKIYLRGDTDFSLTQYFDTWDQQCFFFLGMDARPNLVRIAKGVEQWELFEREPKYEVKTNKRKRPKNVRREVVKKRKFKKIQTESEHIAEFSYKPGKCANTYRMAVLKKRIRIVKGTKTVEEYDRYFFYISNDREKTAKEIIQFYRKRANHENDIEQLKNGVRALHSPLNTFIANWAYMVVVASAWDLKAWYGLLMPSRPIGAGIIRMEFKRFINTFISIPCIIIKTGRKICHRIIGFDDNLKHMLSLACELKKFSFP